MIPEKIKNKIIEAVKEQRVKFESDARMALNLDITPSMYSRVMSGSNAVGDHVWMTIARKLDVDVRDVDSWKVAETPVYIYVNEQLKMCQEKSISGLLCDAANIGKTFSAKEYVKRSANSVYIDCSQVKTKRELIRAIAQGFGVGAAPTYADMYANLIYWLRSANSPLVVLDEAGDLEYPAFLELKALWNATEGCCGWYMMGADGLKAKIERALKGQKVGYAEIFSRYGSRYQKVTPEGGEELEIFTRHQIAVVAKANKDDVDVKTLLAKVGGSLRRVKIELNK